MRSVAGVLLPGSVPALSREAGSTSDFSCDVSQQSPLAYAVLRGLLSLAPEEFWSDFVRS